MLRGLEHCRVLEKTIQQNIVRELRARGCLVYKFDAASQRGVPDLLVIKPGGDVVFMEVKRPGKDLTRQQALHHTRLDVAGADVCVVRSVVQALHTLDCVERKQ